MNPSPRNSDMESPKKINAKETKQSLECRANVRAEEKIRSNDFRLILIGKRYNQNVVPPWKFALRNDRSISVDRPRGISLSGPFIFLSSIVLTPDRQLSWTLPSQRKRHTAVKSDFWISAVSKIQLFSAGVKNLYNTSSLGSAIETMAKSTLVQKRKKLTNIHKLVADTPQRGFK